MPYNLKTDKKSSYVEVNLHSLFTNEIQQVFDLELSLLSNSQNLHSFLFVLEDDVVQNSSDLRVKETLLSVVNSIPKNERIAILTQHSELADFFNAEKLNLDNVRCFEHRSAAIIWLETNS